MYDIDKDLNEIRSIDVAPSMVLVNSTKDTILQQEDELATRRKKSKILNITRFSKILALPAAAAAILIIFVNMAMPTPTSYYSVDINPNIKMAVDKEGIVINMKATDLDINKKAKKDDFIGKPIEYAVSRIIVEAQDEGYLDKGENILIGAFGDDEHNNISKNQVLSYLDNSLSENISLLSIHGSIDDWEDADKDDVSAGLYSLSKLLGDSSITKDITLDDLVLLVQNTKNVDIKTFLDENKEPIVYKAPSITYSLNDDYIVFNWSYIDFKKHNYDGDITYQLISADTVDGLTNSPTIVDEITFASWDKQPTDYSLYLSDTSKDKYYAIVAKYDDGRRFVDGSYALIKGSN